MFVEFEGENGSNDHRPNVEDMELISEFRFSGTISRLPPDSRS